MSTSNYPIFLSPAPAPRPLLTHRVTLLVILSRGTKTVWAWMNKFLPSLLEVVPRDHFFRQRDFPLWRTNSAIHRKNMLMEASFMPESLCVCIRLSSDDSAAPATGCSRRNAWIAGHPNKIKQHFSFYFNQDFFPPNIFLWLWASSLQEQVYSKIPPTKPSRFERATPFNKSYFEVGQTCGLQNSWQCPFDIFQCPAKGLM